MRDRKTKLLVVEDEPAIAFGLRQDLEHEDYSVEVVGTGEDALRRASEASFDLILLDVMLPGKDGFTVARELRRSGQKTPIILLTARTQEIEKVLGLELGADDYITKPFSHLELCARIKAVLRRTAPSEPDRYLFGDVEVDFTGCVVRRAGAAVELTPLEFKVLATLIRSTGRLFSRDQLIDEVWGLGMAVTDRVVDNHIMNLRRKLEANPSEPRYLVSARGLGYRFENPERT